MGFRSSLATALVVASHLLASGSSAENQRVLLLLDGSNSMWGRIDGTEKIVVARDVLAGMLAEFPDETEIGLAAYGHRHEKDCSDIELLVPVGPGTRAAVEAAIGRVQPRGMTPITAALEQLAAALDGTTGATHIVLVSDGKETCDGDPCALAGVLRERGLGLTIHVVGFDVAAEESQQLACIAEAGGGLYASAGSAEDLALALGDISRQVVSAAFDPLAGLRKPVGLPETDGPAWRAVTSEGAVYEGDYFVVHDLGDGLSLQLFNDDAVNIGFLMPAESRPVAEVERAVLTIGRGLPCHLVWSESPFQITWNDSPGWLRGTFSGTLACADRRALLIAGEFRLPEPRQ